MKTVTVNISFRKDLLESIDAAAKLESRTRSEFIREAARNYINGSSGKDNDAVSTNHETKISIDSIPFTSSKDSVKKFDLYEREGVREYWVVRPDEQTIAVFKLGSDNRYGRLEMYTAQDKLKVGIFDSLVIDLPDIFRE